MGLGNRERVPRFVGCPLCAGDERLDQRGARLKKLAWGVRDSLNDDTPMPWAWELCLHCMDMQTGTVLNWPRRGDWQDNSQILRSMRAVWRSWRFHTTSAKEWTPADLAYKDWLDAGKPKAKSEYELWLESRDNG